MGFQETFKALSDPVRRDILTMLKSGKKSAGEISQKFDMTGATISYHLSTLKKADLVTETKFKNFIYYELNTSVFEEIMLWVSQFQKEPDSPSQDTAETTNAADTDNTSTTENKQGGMMKITSV